MKKLLLIIIFVCFSIFLAAEAALFHVNNAEGDSLFAIYPSGIKVWDANGQKILVAGSDSVRFYVNENSERSSRGGFAITGVANRTVGNDIFVASKDSVRLYITEEPENRSSRGGFAIAGVGNRSLNKYFNINRSINPEIIDPSEPRLLWYPEKEAFRVGRVLIASPDSVGTNSIGTGFESQAIGDYSQAFGYQSRALGNYSTAIGNHANAEQDNSFALGDFAQASGVGSYAFGAVGRDANGVSTGTATTAAGDYSMAMGLGSVSNGTSSFAIGTNAFAEGNYSTSIGFDTSAGGVSSIALGKNSNASGNISIAAGNESIAQGETSVAIGYSTEALSDYSTAIGYDATASGTNAISMGSYTVASGINSFAVGYGAEAQGVRSVALGYQSSATANDAFAIGRGAQAGEAGMALGNYAEAGVGGFAGGSSSKATGSSSLALGGGEALGIQSKAIGLIKSSGEKSLAIALDNLSNTTVTANNIMSVMGGRLAVGATTAFSKLYVEENRDNNYAATFFNDGNATNRYGIKIQAGKDDASDTNWMIRARDGDNDFQGGLTLTDGSLGITQGSDRRLKQDIADTNIDALDILKKMRVVDFKYIQTPTRRHVGYIAQEANKVFPNMVVHDEETDLYGVTLSTLIPVLNKAIQEQQEIIEKQNLKLKKIEKEKSNYKNDLEALKSEINEIKKALKQLKN